MKRLAVLFVLFLPLLALGQALPDPGTSVPGFLTSVLAAVKGGDWQLLVGLGLTGLIFVIRKFGAKWIPWLGTSLGGATLAGLIVLLGGLAVALGAHQPITWTLLSTLLVATWTAAGTWTWLRRMLSLVEKIPGAIGKFGGWVLSLLGGDPDAIVKAAADAANTSTPATATGTEIAAGLDVRK
jgi:hypothetical protein